MKQYVINVTHLNTAYNFSRINLQRALDTTHGRVTTRVPSISIRMQIRPSNALSKRLLLPLQLILSLLSLHLVLGICAELSSPRHKFAMVSRSSQSRTRQVSNHIAKALDGPIAMKIPRKAVTNLGGHSAPVVDGSAQFHVGRPYRFSCPDTRNPYTGFKSEA